MALSLKKSSKKDVSAEKPVVSKKVKAEMDKPFVARLPLVNVLSPEVQEVVEQQRLKRLFIGLGAGAAGLVVAAFVAQAGLIALAESKLEAEQTKATELSSREAALAPISSFYGQIEANRSTIQSTMAKEVLTSQVLRELNAVAPTGVEFTTVSLMLDSGAPAGASTDPAAGAGTCPSQNPYETSQASAGCVSVDGEARSRAALGAWLNAIEESDAFTVAFIPSTTADGQRGGGVSFSATIGLNAETVYKNRYADQNFLKTGGE